MSPKAILLAAASAAVLSIPFAALAQSYNGQYGQKYNGQYGQNYNGQYGQNYNRQQGYGQQYDRQPQGDYYSGSRTGYGAYPQFRGIERHIQSEIYDGVRQDLLQRDDASDLISQLRAIQAEEWREYRVHRRNLPYEDQTRIQSELTALDQLVDETRNEP